MIRKRFTTDALRRKGWKINQEPTRQDLSRMPDEEWAKALKRYFREEHREVEYLQWDLMQTGMFVGDGCAMNCYREAIRRIRRKKRHEE